MPSRMKRAAAKATKAPRASEATKASAQSSLEDQVESALTWLKSHGTRRTLEGMARYAIPSDDALGVSVSDIRVLGKRLGRNHELAAALWDTGVYEARMLTSFVDDDASFLEGLRFIERAATDERNFVKKAVNMALRAIGKRNPALNAAAVTVARRLADSPDAAPRWVGKDALRELTSPAMIRRLAARRGPAPADESSLTPRAALRSPSAARS